ncbi:ABC transporter permease [Gracilibacillus alcaliphilus]|uniref:ABC transporter permease n=1 Tax=Gracilibacillus alcaliphilus TaxID=1401441 RepID=UPI00195F0AB2|nr:ABC transporter permease [Gracilibacillus alcaliphilus]MBM7676715.1 ABC-2 type transport system permease protein [Gracilibacillus alcaliphilus]
MNNLIRVEFFKLQRNKACWILIGTVIGISTLFHYLIITDWWMMRNTPFDSIHLSELNGLFAFTVPIFFNLIVSTLAAFYISTEFSPSGVIKNQIISGNKRTQIYLAKFFVFSLGSIFVTIVIPLVTVAVLVILFGRGDIFDFTNMIYLGRAYGLFTLQFLGYTAIILLLSIITNDSGKTIIFSILFTIVMYVMEKLAKPAFLEVIYENSIFYQFMEVFKYTMTSGEIIKSILIGAVSTIIITLCGIFIFNRKEIK